MTNLPPLPGTFAAPPSDLEPPLKMPVALPTATPLPLNYASSSSRADGAAWSQGNLLCIRNGAILPQMCIKCGSPSGVRMYTRNLSWSPPWIYLLLLVNLLVCVIVLLCTRKTIRCTFGLCDVHRTRRVVGLWSCTAGVLAGVAVVILGAVNESAAIALLGVLLFFVALVSLIILSPLLRPTRIDNGVATVKGASPAFLAKLPAER
jgi:hypothetical protein